MLENIPDSKKRRKSEKTDRIAETSLDLKQSINSDEISSESIEKDKTICKA